jgi:hypothetical protein
MIIDLNGKTLISLESKASQIKISTLDLPKGVYFLKIMTAKELLTYEIIKL